MAEQNGGGLLDEVMGAVGKMAGGDHQSSQNGGGGMLGEVMDTLGGGGKIKEIKEDYASGDVDEMKNDVGDVIDKVMGGKTKTHNNAKKATAPADEASQGGGLLDEVMDSVKGSAADAVKGEVVNEVGGLLKGLLGGDK